MFAIIFAWIVISFILLSFGDILIHFYNKFCKQEEKYNFADTFILGICFILIPLQLSSFWLPSNQYILLFYSIICIIYWQFNKNRLKYHLRNIRNQFSNHTKLQLFSIGVIIVSILLYVIWSSCIFDAAFYHHQNIKWNEQYAIVPGLGNLESRFGFNSNYLLLSALFSFRFIFGDAIYALQSALFIIILLWFFNELIKSSFNIKYIILAVIFLLFFFINKDMLADSSTDIIPNICIFYLICRIVLSPNMMVENKLLLITLPITLVTFKLSTFPLCLLSLYVITCLFKEKKYNIAISAIIPCIFIVLFWFIRNIIISGYIVYPMHEIDLFSFDWKIPTSIANQERDGIHNYAKQVLQEVLNVTHYTKSYFKYNKLWLLSNYITIFCYILTVISPFVIIYIYLKRKFNSHLFILYIISVIFIIYWAIFGPDFRFGNGIILALIFITSIMFLQQIQKDNTNYYKQRNIITLIFSLLIFFISGLRSYHHLNEINQSSLYKSDYPLSQIYFKPFSSNQLGKLRGISTNDFSEYKMNDNITIYISREYLGRCFDKLPAIAPYNSDNIPKFQDTKNIEPRGKSIQKGFRVKN